MGLQESLFDALAFSWVMLAAYRSDGFLGRVAYGAQTRIMDGVLGRANCLVIFTLWNLFKFFMVPLGARLAAIFPPETYATVFAMIWVSYLGSDALSEIVGSLWGKQKLRVWGIGEVNRKSLAGTGACFVGSLAICLCLVHANGLGLAWVGLAVALSVSNTAFELFSPRGTDDFTMATANALLCWALREPRVLSDGRTERRRRSRVGRQRPGRPERGERRWRERRRARRTRRRPGRRRRRPGRPRSERPRRLNRSGRRPPRRPRRDGEEGRGRPRRRAAPKAAEEAKKAGRSPPHRRAATGPKPSGAAGAAAAGEPEAALGGPSFTVNDIQKSLAFYRDVLGFTLKERWEQDGELHGVEMVAGSVTFWLGQDDWKKGRDRVKGQGFRMYCGTSQDIDAMARRIRAAGGTLLEEPKDQPWGGRDFAVADPDGFTITFASGM